MGGGGAKLPCQQNLSSLLPPAYVVRGKVMFWHASVHPSIHPWFCLSTGGGGGGGRYPYPIMLCNISQNAMGQPGGGGTLVGGTLPGGVPCQGGTLLGGVPCRGGTQLGQHREYLLHGRRYASCVHAGGLSCLHKCQWHRLHIMA